MDLVHNVSAPVEVSDTSEKLTSVNRRYLPFCAYGNVFDVNNVHKSVVFLRDSGSLQSLVCKQLVQCRVCEAI